MALVTTLRVGGFRKFCKDPILLSKKCDRWLTPVATICGKAKRIHFEPKPKPWPYIKYGYCNPYYYIDGTTKRFDENSRVIFVEGPPAIGKSKVAYALAEEFDMRYFPMVTMDYLYVNAYGSDMRSLNHKLSPKAQCFDEETFLKNPQSMFAPRITFMLYYLKVSQYIDALRHLFNTGQGVVLERSMYSDYAFAEAMYQCSYLYKAEMDGYYKYKVESHEDLLRPHLYVYLDASVDTVLENLKKRGKGEEKIYNREFLTIVEDVYKHKFLSEMEKHSEILMYDWNVPVDPISVIEDIENIDLNRFIHHDSQLLDWTMLIDEDAYCEHRWLYTQHKDWMLSSLRNPLVNCPRLFTSIEERDERDNLFDSELPGHRYLVGFNTMAGDKFTWSWRRPTYAEISELTPSVTEMLVKKVKDEIAASS